MLKLNAIPNNGYLVQLLKLSTILNNGYLVQLLKLSTILDNGYLFQLLKLSTIPDKSITMIRSTSFKEDVGPVLKQTFSLVFPFKACETSNL